MRLEPLKSQSALIQLITEAIQGMSGERKALQDLGPDPTKDQVMACLQRATCLKMPGPKPSVSENVLSHMGSDNTSLEAEVELDCVACLLGRSS